MGGESAAVCRRIWVSTILYINHAIGRREKGRPRVKTGTKIKEKKKMML